MHAHQQATITILLEGAFDESYPFSSRLMRCRSSSILFRPAGEPHADRIGAEGAHNLVVELDAARVDSLREHTRVFESTSAVSDDILTMIVAQMQREFRRSDSAAPLALEGHVFELLAHTERSKHAAGARPLWLAELRALIHDRFREQGLRMSDLAGAVGVHPVHVARMFRAEYGVTPGAYLRRVRLDWAADELSRGERALAEIAEDAGFADQSHFTRAFRRAFSVTPALWRASLRRRV